MTETSKRTFPIAIVWVVIAFALFGFAISRFSFAGDDAAAALTVGRAEADDTSTVHDVREWHAPVEAPPQQRATPDELRPDYVVRIGIDAWPGWAALVHANDGFAPKKVWTTRIGRQRSFLVELVPFESASRMREAFAAGTLHFATGTVDMLPYIHEAVAATPDAHPQVLLQLDWSTGGDGIVARGGLTSPAALAGKIVVVAERSPAHYLLLAALYDAGVPPSQVTMRLVASDAEAAAAFTNDPAIAACALRAPRLGELDELPDTALIASTRERGALIADVWFGRSAFTHRFHGISATLGHALLGATTTLATDEKARAQAAQALAQQFSLAPAAVTRALAEHRWTNYADSRAFLLDANNPASFERTFATAAVVWNAPASLVFDHLVDSGVVRRLGQLDELAAQRRSITPAPSRAVMVRIDHGGKPTIAQRLTLHFRSGSSELEAGATALVAEARRLATLPGTGRVLIEGHTDTSLREWGDEKLQLQLAIERARSVARVLALPADRVSVTGFGAERPASLGDPGNHARNRRVEITIIPSVP